jgi:hypothetical protein
MREEEIIEIELRQLGLQLSNYKLLSLVTLKVILIKVASFL